MRSISWLFLVMAACGGNDVNPRIIAGGGIGDGAIDGELNVGVIDHTTEAPIVGATVQVGTAMKTTDSKGFATFSGVSGPQTVTVKADSYRSAVWVAANGANVTLSLTLLDETPDQATLSGSISGYDAITVPTGHVKIAAVLYSQSDDLGDAANNISTPNSGNVCLTQMACNWTIATRTGAVTLVAAILDRDTKGTPADSTDDTQTIIGWATKTGVTVDKGVDQTGLVLTPVQAGDLDTAMIDFGTPPPSLTDTQALVGIEVGNNEVVQLPASAQIPVSTSVVVPKPTVFGPDATFRLTAIAQTSSGGMGAQSVVVRHKLSTTSLAAGTWLVPPAGVTATRTNAAYQPVAGAKAHSVTYLDSTGKTLLEITVFDTKTTSVDVPALVALPTTGALTAKVNGIAADFDVTDFSLDADRDQLTGISAQPVTIQ
jgi:hypothetical protein